MKIRMLVSIAGSGFALGAGDETENFSDAEAVRLIEAGFAVPVVEKTMERAVAAPAPETRRAGRSAKASD
ncbi:MAG: hypothetical protein J0H17_18725 [Rhizobiales bacterium]|nr:hypothetical protein [Hyphomicrobiales bacterium]